MKRSALRDRAAECGADEEALEEADDADDPKEAFIAIILAGQASNYTQDLMQGSAALALRTRRC